MKTLIKWLGLILMVAAVLYGIHLRVLNMDMTDLRFIVTYWKNYLVMLIAISIGILVSMIN